MGGLGEVKRRSPSNSSGGGIKKKGKKIKKKIEEDLGKGALYFGIKGQIFH